MHENKKQTQVNVKDFIPPFWLLISQYLNNLIGFSVLILQNTKCQSYCQTS